MNKSATLMKLCLLCLLFSSASSLRVPAAAAHGLAAACIGFHLCSPPAQAIGPPPTLNDAIVELAEASYPILKAQQAETFAPFQDKVGSLLLKKIKPEKLAKSIDLGLDALNSVPDEKVRALEAAVKEAYSGVNPQSCDLVALPPTSLVERVKASDAVAKVDPSKLQRFGDKYGGAYKALAKTDAAICLPSAEALDKLALAQADVGRAIGAEESKKFGVWTEAALKSSIGLSDALPLATDAKKLAPSATAQEKLRFQKAGKTVENAAAGEAARARLAKQQAGREAYYADLKAKSAAQ